MDIEALRDYCLSLAPEVEEKFPFTKFRAGKDVLVFYIGGHMFCYFDINDLSLVSMKSTAEDAARLREDYDYVGLPYQARLARTWIGVDATRADPEVLKSLVAASFHLIAKRR